MSNFPDTPEAVALALMQMIDETDKKDASRRRSNTSERERLLSLYKDCLWAVTGLEREELVLH
jgi:hypothetical protein